MKPQSLKLSVIRTDAGTQVRCKPCEETVSEYAAAMANGDKFPPAVIFHDGSEYFMADGFHRLLACQRNGFLDILADVRTGTRSDALKYALGANVAHGLRRTNADKRRSVELALAEWPNLSDREIGNICAVNHETVAAARPQLADSASSPPRTGADGKTRKMPKLKEKSPPKSQGKSDPAAVESLTERVKAANEAEGVKPFSEPIHCSKHSPEVLAKIREHVEPLDILRQTLGIIIDEVASDDFDVKTLDDTLKEMATALSEIKAIKKILKQ